MDGMATDAHGNMRERIYNHETPGRLGSAKVLKVVDEVRQLPVPVHLQ
jgi:hypothetical protein